MPVLPQKARLHFGAASLLTLAGSAPAQDCLWTSLSVESPPTRSVPATAYDSIRHKLVLFGGLTNPGTGLLDLADTWEWNGASWTQLPVSGPPGRHLAAMAFDPARGKCILYGGRYVIGPFSNYGYLGDTWEWDGVQWTNRTSSPSTDPGERAEHMLAYDSARERTVLFGGDAYNNHYYSTWEWDGVSWALRAASGPPGQFYGAFNPARSRILITTDYSTWEWDGAAWLQLSSTGATSSLYPSSTFLDTTRNIIVAYESRYGRTSEWNGSSWTLRSTYGPASSPDGIHFLTYDSALGRALAFTGYGVLTTWLWNGAATRDYLTITQPPATVQTTVGGTAIFNVAVNNPPPLTYQWYKAGVALQDNPRITGSQAPQLTISTIEQGDYDQYSVTVSDACASRVAITAIIPPSQGNCYPNCDSSTNFPFLNANDFQCFLNVFAMGCPDPPASCYANCDGSTSPPILNANDFQCYLNKFAAGCSAP